CRSWLARPHGYERALVRIPLHRPSGPLLFRACWQVGHQGKGPTSPLGWGVEEGMRPEGRGWGPTCRESSYRRMTTPSTCMCQNPESMTWNEPAWAAQAPDPEAVVWHPEVARRLAAKGVGSGTVATDTLLLLRLWRDGRGSMVEATYDSLAEQVAMTRTRVREAISRLEKIGV